MWWFIKDTLYTINLDVYYAVDFDSVETWHSCIFTKCDKFWPDPVIKEIICSELSINKKIFTDEVFSCKV